MRLQLANGRIVKQFGFCFAIFIRGWFHNSHAGILFEIPSRHMYHRRFNLAVFAKLNPVQCTLNRNHRKLDAIPQCRS